MPAIAVDIESKKHLCLCTGNIITMQNEPWLKGIKHLEHPFETAPEVGAACKSMCSITGEC